MAETLVGVAHGGAGYAVAGVGALSVPPEKPVASGEGRPRTYWMDDMKVYAQTMLSMEAKVVGEQYAELKTAEGGAWSTTEMIQRGFTTQALDQGRRQFQFAYWRDRFGGYHYPKWQFDRSMKLLAEVTEILALFRTHDTMRVLTWFVRPVTRSSKSLLDLIRTGSGGRAVAIVRKEERQNASVGPLSKKDAAELRRRMKDYKDPTRYVSPVAGQENT